MDRVEQKKFERCYLSIPLPDQYKEEYASILEAVSSVSPSLRVMDSDNPHVTFLYMGRVRGTDRDFDFIKKVIEEGIERISGVELLVEGADIFADHYPGKPTALHLKVAYPPVFFTAHYFLRRSLYPYMGYKGKGLLFDPHLTVAYIPESRSVQRNFSNTKAALEEIVGRVSWRFNVTGALLRGKDRAVPGRKLLTIAGFPLDGCRIGDFRSPKAPFVSV